MIQYYKKHVLPKLFFIPYFFIFLFLKFLSLFYKNKKEKKSKLLISAGYKGWDSIEYKEIHSSATEYLGNDSQVIIHKLYANNNYISDIINIIKNDQITHVFYDPRTGEQSLLKGFMESFKLSIIFTKNNIIPIVYHTDISNRIWRIKGSIISSITGINICFVSPKKIGPIFPNKRLFGPFLMPFSNETKSKINNKIISSTIKNNKAYFIGSLYEPRTKMLNFVKKRLNERGIDLEIQGRILGTKRKPDDEYWNTFIEAPIIFTTADQIETLNELDWNWIPSLIYRYTEALACRALLVAPLVPSVEKYFKSGKHFVGFQTLEEAVDKIEYYLINKKEREAIAIAGEQKVLNLIKSQSFWLQIDTCLAQNPIL
jgi:hypothetical protein